MDEKKKFIQVRLGRSKYINEEKNLNLHDLLEEACGNEIGIKIVEMTQEEFEKLPEFQGF